MERIVLIDGNSILNRAFYGIMGNKMLMTEEGTYTNAVYGFLSILFKIQEDLTPEYMVVTFDQKGPTKRHEMYQEYKANRKGMPDELAVQMPMIKEILEAMNIKIIEKQGYEGDDIIGTLSRFGEVNGLQVTILSGDRDNFQLATDTISIQIPRTKEGKTQTDTYDRKKVLEEYGVEPYQLIQVKGLMGDTSDNIPGVPGVGEKTALSLIQQYTDIDNLYQQLENRSDTIKGKLREKLVENKELAYLSRELGRININSPIEKNLEEMKVEDWNQEKVLELFKKYRFNRYIDRFHLQEKVVEEIQDVENLFTVEVIDSPKKLEKVILEIKEKQTCIYYMGTIPKEDEEYIIKQQISNISIISPEKKIVYYYSFIQDILAFKKNFQTIFEDEAIKLFGFELARDYILLKQIGIQANTLACDVKIAAYLLSPTTSKYTLEGLASQYLKLDIHSYLEKNQISEEKSQINLFDTMEVPMDNTQQDSNTMYAYCISQLAESTMRKLKEIDSLELFQKIEMPLVKVLADMQYTGMYVDKEELIRIWRDIKKTNSRINKANTGNGRGRIQY